MRGIDTAAKALASVLYAARLDEESLRSGEVADALGGFFTTLRRGDAREEVRARVDDGLILVGASQGPALSFELFGYVWWIEQRVDAFVANVRLAEEGSGIAQYRVRCVVVLPPDPPLGRHLRRMRDDPRPDHIEHAWVSGQLTPDGFEWLLDYSGPLRSSPERLRSPSGP